MFCITASARRWPRGILQGQRGRQGDTRVREGGGHRGGALQVHWFWITWNIIQWSRNINATGLRLCELAYMYIQDVGSLNLEFVLLTIIVECHFEIHATSSNTVVSACWTFAGITESSTRMPPPSSRRATCARFPKWQPRAERRWLW